MLHRRKARKGIPLFKTDDEALIDNSESMNKALNEYYFLSSIYGRKPNVDRRSGADIHGGRKQNNYHYCPYGDKLKKAKSPGAGKNFRRVLKESKTVISESLANIFRKSVDSGMMPRLWRQANVVCILKNGDR